MSLLREFFEGKGKPLVFEEPKPAAAPTYEQKAARLAAAEMENAVLSANGGSIRPRRTPTADELRQADEQKAALDAANAEVASGAATLAEMQAKVEAAERAASEKQRAEAQLAADVKARLDNAKKVRREQKRAKKGRK